MVLHTFGLPEKPVILLLHGAGLDWWAYREAAELLSDEYRVVLPTIDGYGAAAHEGFVSIAQSAQNLTEYIQKAHGGHVFALGGLSLGAQIALETLCQKPDIADFAVLESALVRPIAGVRQLAAPMVSLSFGLIRRRWFAKAQAKALGVPPELFEQYYADSLNITRETLVNTLVSNGTYFPGAAAGHITAKTLVLGGSREVGAERKSARWLHETIRGSELFIAPNLKHGELSLLHAQEYVRRLRAWFAGDRA